MSMLDRVVTKPKPTPARICVYGPDKVGKSKLASQFPEPIFLDLEKKADQLRPMPPWVRAKTFNEVRDLGNELLRGKHGYKSLVIDTLDWLEPLIWKHVCEEEGEGNDIEGVGGGFKKGYTKATDVWRELLGILGEIQEHRGMHVILLAHSAVKTFKNPAGGDYGRVRMRLYAEASDLIRQWCKAVLYANFSAPSVRRGKLEHWKKAGSMRWLYTSWNPAFVAGNNYSLPEPRIELDGVKLLRLIEATQPGEAERPPIDPDLIAEIDEGLSVFEGENLEKARAYYEDAKTYYRLSDLRHLLNKIRTTQEEALPFEGDPPEQPAKTDETQAEGQTDLLYSEASELIEELKSSGDELPDIEERLEKATTVVELEALLEEVRDKVAAAFKKNDQEAVPADAEAAV